MKSLLETIMGDQPKGMDLFMSLDTNDNYIRTSKNEARLKTDYEKALEKEVTRLSARVRDLDYEVKAFNKLNFLQRLFYKKDRFK